MGKPSAEYFFLLQKFIDAFTNGQPLRASVQKKWKRAYDPTKEFGYYPLGRPVVQNDYTEHFFQTPIDQGNHIQGSLAFGAQFKEQALKWIAIDIDDEERKRKAETLLIPHLVNNYGILALKELGGDNFDRCKYWIRVNSKIPTARHFFRQVFLEAGCDPIQEFDEIFGVNKLDHVCRIFGGPHLSRGAKRFPIEIEGELVENPLEMIRHFLSLPVVTEEFMLPLLKDIEREDTRPKATTVRGDSVFRYWDQNLKPALEDIPVLLQPIFRNCPAWKSVLDDIVFNRFLDERHETTHWGTRSLCTIAMFNDARMARRGTKISQGRDWIAKVVNKFRHRNPLPHNWDSNYNNVLENPDRYFPSCEKMEEKLDRCAGCKFQGIVHSPKQFMFGKAIKRKILSEVRLTTPEEIRETTFVRIKERLKYLVDAKLRETMLLASPQQSGKSFLVSEASAELAKDGKRILIVVPSAKLAIEQRNRLKDLGVSAFVLMSHKNIFHKEHKYLADFACPKYEEIQAQASLGVGSGLYKKEYCEACPLLEKCYYPNQYTQVMEEKYPVVIIQHAHLQCQEVIYDLMAKQFDVMFIDESFINSVYAAIRIDPAEIGVLEKFEYGWAQRLADWLRGEKDARGELNPSGASLEAVRFAFEDAGLMRWTIPDYVRYFNQKRSVNKVTGIEIVYEVPTVPIKIFTDATPPVELIKQLTGIEEIVVYGDNEVIDYRKIHPENEVIQILDANSSVSFLEDGDRFEQIMFKIAELVELKYTKEKILLTVYKRHFERVEKFFQDHSEEFPTARSRITIDRMDKGTNAYKEYDAQFLLAGVNFTGGLYQLEAYKYKTVANYYNHKNGYSQLPNVFPYGINFGASVSNEKCPVRRIEAIGNHGGVFEYEDFDIYPPDDKWHQMIYDHNVANTQQAIRLRFEKDKPRRVYVMTNFFLPSFLVTKSIMLKDFLQPLDKIEELW